MRHLAFALLLVITLPNATARASALRVLLLPTLSEAGTPEAVAAQLQAALRTALQAHDAWSVSELNATSSVTGDASCRDEACARQALAASDADVALRLRIFRLRQAHSATILAFAAPDATYAADVPVEGSQVEALRAALEDLEAQLSRGPGPWLALAATPHDATAKLDGRVLGMLPLTARVAPGEHVLEVLHDGYETYNTTVTIPELSGAVHELKDITLTPTAVRSDASPSSRRHRHARILLASGTGLAVAGGIATAFGLRALLIEGECKESCGTPNPELYDPRWSQATNVALTAAGAAALITGVTLASLGLVRGRTVSVAAGDHGILLLAKGRF